MVEVIRFLKKNSMSQRELSSIKVRFKGPKIMKMIQKYISNDSDVFMQKLAAISKDTI